MLKLKIKWEMEDGAKFEEWTRPIEMAMAERELYNGKSIVSVLKTDEVPSNNLIMYLAHRIHQRLSEKPVGNLEQWSKKVVDLAMPEFELGKASNPEA
jgi:hypothetical protein